MRWSDVAIVSTVVLAFCPATAQTFPSLPDHLTSLIQEEKLGDEGLGIAEIKARLLLPLALDLIKDFEKWVPNAYDDASMFCTIGYGHLIAKKSCASSMAELEQFTPPLSVSAGSNLLDKDTTIARIAVKNLVTEPLNDEQFGALTSFVFNVGSKNFANSTMLKYLNNGEYPGAAKQFARWISSKGKPLDGLITRRACEASLFTGKLAYGVDNKFHRDDCETLGAVPPTESLIDIETGELR
jgi:lysozyme